MGRSETTRGDLERFFTRPTTSERLYDLDADALRGRWTDADVERLRMLVRTRGAPRPESDGGTNGGPFVVGGAVTGLVGAACYVLGYRAPSLALLGTASVSGLFGFGVSLRDTGRLTYVDIASAVRVRPARGALRRRSMTLLRDVERVVQGIRESEAWHHGLLDDHHAAIDLDAEVRAVTLRAHQVHDLVERVEHARAKGERRRLQREADALNAATQQRVKALLRYFEGTVALSGQLRQLYAFEPLDPRLPKSRERDHVARIDRLTADLEARTEALEETAGLVGGGPELTEDPGAV